MKKNPLFISRTNANKSKIRYAKKGLFLTLFCLFSVLFISTLSASNAKTIGDYGKCFAGSVVSLGFIPFAAKVKGTKALNGHDETDDEFKARGEKAESDVDFAKRYMKSQIDEAVKVTSEKFQADLKALGEKLEAIKTPEDLTAIKDEMRKHGIAIEAMKDVAVVRDRSIKEGSIAETLAKNKEKIEGFMSRKSGVLEIEHKSHISQTSTDIGSRGDTYFDMHEGGRIGQIPVRKPFLRELFKGVNAGSEYIKYMDQDTVVRSAANVALCAASNSTTKLTWVPRSVQISKIRDYIDLCSDMMNDYSFVDGEIRNLISSSVALKIDDQLLNGTGTHPELNSLSLVSSTWAANIAGTKDWTGVVAAPNLVNLLAIAKSQIAQLGQNNAWNANVALVNPGDLEAIMHLKNTLTDAVRFYPGMFVDNGGNCYINGMLLIANPNITADTAWLGDFTKGTVYARPGIGIEFSYENSTNFETETVTVKAFERLNLLVRHADTNAFMKITSIASALSTIGA